MTRTLSNGQKYVSVSEASLLLGVSIDTLRRWDKAGKLASYRLNGKDRYFLKDELHHFQQERPLSISEAARILHVSDETLRRMDRKGILVAKRDSNGERIYSKTALQTFLHSRKRKKTLSIEKPSKTIPTGLRKLFPQMQRAAFLRSRFCFIVVLFVFSVAIRMSQFHSG
jgi:excisionase family DNA binding protein